MVSLESTIKPSPEVLFRDFEGESVLLNLNDESYYGLDEVGTSMWQALTETGTVEMALERLAAEYDVEEAILRRDLLKLTNELFEKGIVVAES